MQVTYHLDLITGSVTIRLRSPPICRRHRCSKQCYRALPTNPRSRSSTEGINCSWPRTHKLTALPARSTFRYRIDPERLSNKSQKRRNYLAGTVEEMAARFPSLEVNTAGKIGSPTKSRRFTGRGGWKRRERTVEETQKERDRGARKIDKEGK